MSQRRSGEENPNFCNGFPATPEVEVPAIEISDKNIAPYSLPQEALSFEPDAQTIVHNFKNGDKERKLHMNIEISEEEKEKLKFMQEQAEAEGITFLPSMTVLATRYLSQARGDGQLAVALMKKTHDWRLTYFRQPMPERAFLEDMRYGISYFCGRDKCLRPALVFRARRIPSEWHRTQNYDRVIAVVIYCMEYLMRYMVVPGRVEGINIICDMAEMGISQVPVSALKEIHRTMGSHYTGRVFKFYVCNMPWLLRSLVGVAKGVLSDRQKQKLIFVNDNKELQQDFALHQLEEDLGGSRPVINDYFPFPLLPGPFEAGYAGGPDNTRVPNVHQALTAAGTRGRLWDPQRSHEENVRLDYTEDAEEILTKCNLPIPPHCPRGKGKLDQVAEANETTPVNLKEHDSSIANMSPTPAPTGAPKIIPDESPTTVPDESPNRETVDASPTSIEDEDDVIVQNAQVKPGSGFLCCMALPCTAGRG